MNWTTTEYSSQILLKDFLNNIAPIQTFMLLSYELLIRDYVKYR